MSLDYFVELIQNGLINEKLSYYYSQSDALTYFNKSLTLFNNLLPLLIAVLTTIAIYIFYIKHKFKLQYKLEKSPEIDTSPKSINTILENSNSVFYLLKKLYSSSFLVWIIWILLLTITYFIFGYTGIKVIIAILISLHIIVFFKISSKLFEIQIEEGHNNFGYISSYVTLVSVAKLMLLYIPKVKEENKNKKSSRTYAYLKQISFGNQVNKIISGSLSFISLLLRGLMSSIHLFKFARLFLISIVIPTILILNSFQIFIFYELLLLFYYGCKCIPLSQVVNTMSKEPSFVNLEIVDGEIIENLLLHQTTSVDYRVKNYKTYNEFIVPVHNVKKMSEDFTFELNQLDNVTNHNFLHILNDTGIKYDLMIKGFIVGLIQPSMYKIWYKKALIYMKMNELDKVKLCLEKAIESSDHATMRIKKNKIIHSNFISFLKNDNRLSEIKNEKWLIELLDKSMTKE